MRMHVGSAAARPTLWRLWQLLVLTLIIMVYLLYKNQHRAKAFLLSFLNFEAVLVVEVCPTHGQLILLRSSVTVQIRCIAVQLCIELWDISSGHPPQPPAPL